MNNLKEVIDAAKEISNGLKSIGKNREAEDILDTLKIHWTTTSEGLELILESFDKISSACRDDLPLEIQRLFGETYLAAKKMLSN